MAGETDRQRFVRLLRARHACVVISTAEEAHAVATVVGAAVDVGRPVQTWSVVRGICEGLFVEEHQPETGTETAAGALRAFAQEGRTRVLVLLDLASHLDNAVVLRAFREAIDAARRGGSTLVLVDPGQQLPDVVTGVATRFDISLPDDGELAAIAKDALRRLKADESFTVDLTQAQFAALVRNLRGLTREQAGQVVRDVALTDDRLDASDVQAVAVLKRRLLHTHGLLDAVEAPVSLDQVAGVAGLKRWLRLRRPDLPGVLEAPRGVLLLGVPGAGKSLCAKAIATAWERPLLRLDPGVLFDRYVGESERRLRDALRQAEALAPAVLWIDEIEKAFASAASRSSDGGLSQRMFGSLLTWMQEHPASVFLVATANDIEALPPELLRKGRFDELFFVDLPTREARVDLLRIHLARRGIDLATVDHIALAEAADGRSGAEIEQAVIAARFAAADEGVGSPSQRHLLAALAGSPPLAVTMAERIAGLRAWAKNRCVPAE